MNPDSEILRWTTDRPDFCLGNLEKGVKVKSLIAK